MNTSQHVQAPATVVGEVLAAQKTIYRTLMRNHMREWIELDLSMGQLKALMILASNRSMTVTALAETLEVGKPAASVLVDRLVHLGYAERTEDAADRRRTLVTPTAAGSDLVGRLRAGQDDRMVRWIEELSSADRDALARGLRALANIAERDTIEPAPAADTTC